MTLPQIIVDLLTLLFDMAVPAAICTMVLAGIALWQEGGVNFQAGGRFQRWALWSVILLTLPQLLSWFRRRVSPCLRRAEASAVRGSQACRRASAVLFRTSWLPG